MDISPSSRGRHGRENGGSDGNVEEGKSIKKKKGDDVPSFFAGREKKKKGALALTIEKTLR